MNLSKLNQFKKNEISNGNTTVGGGLNTTYGDSTGGSTGSYEDTWYLFKKNNKSTITLEGEPDGHTDYTNNPAN